MERLIFIFRQLHAVIPKRKEFFDMQFPFLPVGVKWKVVKNVHCPFLLINTGLMSIGPLTKKLLQKHRPVSYSKKRRELALSPRPLLKAPQRASSPSLMHIATACTGQCLLHRTKTMKKNAVKHDQLCPFGGHTV